MGLLVVQAFLVHMCDTTKALHEQGDCARAWNYVLGIHYKAFGLRAIPCRAFASWVVT